MPFALPDTKNLSMFEKVVAESLTFDDVLLVPAHSHVLPDQVKTGTRLSRNITLGIPLLSAAMDTVSESAMAIAMAQMGGLGIIHRNMNADKQAAEIRKVKRFESALVEDPITIHPEATLAQAKSVMHGNRISGVPVVDQAGKLVGILTNRDVRFADNPDQPINELMTKDNLVTAHAKISKEEAKKLLHKHRIEKLLIVDEDYHCTGLMTVKDIEKSATFPHASKDPMGRLRAGAATGTGKTGIERAEIIMQAGLDVLVVDTAHGHSQNVIDTVKHIIANKPKHLDIIAGNIATAAAAEALIEAGVDGVKVGIGPGSICTTRIVAGVGVPQLSAVMAVADACRKHDIPVIADGGIRYSGDMAKAIAAGADSVMVGSMLAGTDEAPGEVVLYQGRSYKSYRGMGSVGAMEKGSADRYFQGNVAESRKLVPEGIEGRVPYKGAVGAVLHQMIGGLRAAMGYTGCDTVKDMHNKAAFTKITGAGIAESHVHDVTITAEAPNYRKD